MDLPGSGRSRNSAADGGRLFVADGPEGVHVYDLEWAGGMTPAWLATLSTVGTAYDVLRMDSLLYVGEAGRISQWRAYPPFTEVASVSLPGNVLGLAVDATNLYAANDAVGLVVLDRVTLAVLDGDNRAGRVQDVMIVGTTIVATDLDLGLRVADTRNPSFADSIALPGEPRGLAALGSTVYVAAGRAGLLVIDVSDPLIPHLTREVVLGANSRDVSVAGATLYVAEGTGGIAVLDASVPGAPTVTTTVGLTGDVLGVAAVEDWVVAALDTRGIAILDARRPRSAPLNAVLRTPGDAVGAFGVGDAIYVCDGRAGIQIVDISGHDPRIVTTVTDFDGPVQIVVDDTLGYVATAAGRIGVLDVVVPSAPRAIGSVASSGSLRLALADSLLLAATFTGRSLEIYRTSSGAEPVLIRTLATGGLAADVATTATGLAVVAAHTSGIRVVELRSGEDAVEIASVLLSGPALGIAITGDFAVVTEGSDGVEIVDLTLPRQPTLVAGVKTSGSASRACVFDDYAYVADRHGGVQVIDIRIRHRPEFLGTLHVAGSVESATVFDRSLLVTDDVAGLSIAGLQCR